jgi:hypothetical protein
MHKAHFSYFGGSGGFFALWHILLGTDFNCDFRTDKQFYKQLENKNAYNDIRGSSWPAYNNLPESIDALPMSIQQELDTNNGWHGIVERVIEDRTKPAITNEHVYKQHWTVSKDRKDWKKTEVTPNNELTSKSVYNHKLFFECNPTVHQLQEGNYNKKILLYTDYETQDMLAKNKNAWIHPPGNVRTADYNGINVYYRVAEIAKHATHTILLQDIVKTNGQALLNAFDTNTNVLNLSHNDMWLNLHTNEEKQRLLK